MKRFSVVFAALAVAAPGALAAKKPSMKVSPKTVRKGKKVTISGSVPGCPGPATIYSTAFKKATKQNFAGIPSVTAKLNKHHNFSIKVKISKKVKKGRYTVTGRCGGGPFASVVLSVKKANGGGGNFGFY